MLLHFRQKRENALHCVNQMNPKPLAMALTVVWTAHQSLPSGII